MEEKGEADVARDENRWLGGEGWLDRRWLGMRKYGCCGEEITGKRVGLG
jgi:hypothetical protein